MALGRARYHTRPRLTDESPSASSERSRKPERDTEEAGAETTPKYGGEEAETGWRNVDYSDVFGRSVPTPTVTTGRGAPGDSDESRPVDTAQSEPDSGQRGRADGSDDTDTTHRDTTENDDAWLDDSDVEQAVDAATDRLFAVDAPEDDNGVESDGPPAEINTEEPPPDISTGPSPEDTDHGAATTPPPVPETETSSTDSSPAPDAAESEPDKPDAAGEAPPSVSPQPEVRAEDNTPSREDKTTPGGLAGPRSRGGPADGPSQNSAPQGGKTVAVAPRSDDTFEAGQLLSEVESAATSYRLKIGGEVYDNIDPQGLASLFHRGIWVVADEIAEDDGPWMPVESHPIFERLRHVIADGVTELLLTHGQLVDERRSAEDTSSTTASQSPETKDQPAPEDDPRDDESPPRPEESLADDQRDGDKSTVELRITEQQQSDRPSELLSWLRPGTTTLPWTVALTDQQQDDQPAEQLSRLPSQKTTVPWAVALVMTAAASVLGTYALLVEPEADTDQPDAVPGAAVATPIDESKLEQRARDRREEELAGVRKAVDEAAGTVTAATEHTPAQLAERALADERHPEARLIAARASADSPNDDQLQELFDRAVEEDFRLDRRTRPIVPGVDADGMAPITEGASITLRLTEDGEERYAFKVDRDEWRDGWRVEVAAYKLCELLVCELDFPEHEPARISERNFRELYWRDAGATTVSYANQRFDELIWTTEEGHDGTERDYLYGVLKEWVPEYARWPVEVEDTWRRWVDVRRSEEVLQEDTDEFHERLRQAHDGPYGWDLDDHMQGHPTRQLARQLSTLHVFDYLTTNFDRYSLESDNYGVNAHFADGRFVPIDNSTAFQYYASGFTDEIDNRVALVYRRLQNVSRFSRSLVATIRMLDPQVVNPVLFPDPTEREQQRLELFWEQRDRFLEYVDELIEEHGEEAVFAFE